MLRSVNYLWTIPATCSRLQLLVPCKYLPVLVAPQWATGSWRCSHNLLDNSARWMFPWGHWAHVADSPLNMQCHHVTVMMSSWPWQSATTDSTPDRPSHEVHLWMTNRRWHTWHIVNVRCELIMTHRILPLSTTGNITAFKDTFALQLERPTLSLHLEYDMLAVICLTNQTR